MAPGNEAGLPGRASLVVPFACHIEGSIPVPSGQPRSISLTP